MILYIFNFTTLKINYEYYNIQYKIYSMFKILNTRRLFWENLKYDLMSDEDRQEIDNHNKKLIKNIIEFINKSKYDRAMNLYINLGFELPIGQVRLDLLDKIDETKLSNNDLKRILLQQKITHRFYINDYDYVIKNTPILFEQFSSKLKFADHDASARCSILHVESYRKSNQPQVARLTLEEYLNEDISLFAKGSLLLYKYDFFSHKLLYLEQAHDMYLQAGFVSDAIFALILYGNKIALMNMSKNNIVENQLNKLSEHAELQDIVMIGIYFYERAFQYKELKKYDIAFDYAIKALKYSSIADIPEFNSLKYRAVGIVSEIMQKSDINQEKVKEQYNISIKEKYEGTNQEKCIDIFEEGMKIPREHGYWEIEKIIRIDRNFELFEQLKNKYSNSEYSLAHLYLRYAECNDKLNLKERIAYLDKSYFITQNYPNFDQQRAHILKVYANIFLRNDKLEQYLEFAEKYLNIVCFDSDFNKNYIEILIQNKYWSKLEDFTKLYKEKVDNNDYNKFLYAKSLYMQNQSNNLNLALTILISIKNTIDQIYKDDLDSMINKLIENNAKPDFALLKEQEDFIVTIRTFEKSLDNFITYIQSNIRMDYWEYDKTSKTYSWISKPEQRAKRDLQLYLQTEFKENLLMFDEIRTGAGFIDLYLKFNSGLEIIIELKMCGTPYTTNYALQGKEQLAHYLRNRQSKFGYLVVFDGRKRDFEKNLRENINNSEYSIIVKAVDMRTTTKQN